MKPLLTFAWIAFALDALLVLMMFATKNMGDDAAGRGLATGWALVLTPILLAAGGGLYWAQRRGSFAGVLVASLVVGLPFITMAKNMAMAPVSSISRALRGIGEGTFDDAILTQVASAVEEGDTAKVRSLVGQGVKDWSARDRHGRTILGITVDVATRNIDDRRGTALVRLLVGAGAKYQDDALEKGGRLFSDLAYNAGDGQAEMMDLLLRAGANPNDTERFDGRPLLIHHNMNAAKARVLLAHGADLLGIRDDRTDRPGWDALMNAAYLKEWELATLYLEKGCDPTYKATDGKTIQDVIAEHLDLERDTSGKVPEGPDALGPGFDAFTGKVAGWQRGSRPVATVRGGKGAGA